MPPLTARPAAILARMLVELPDLVAEAYNALAMGPAKGIPVRNPNGPGSRPPLDLTALSLVGGVEWDGSEREEGDEPSVDAVLSYWCAVHSGQPCSSITTATAYLLRVHDDMCDQDYADLYLADVRWHHRRLSRMAPPVEALPVAGACGACDLATLQAQPGGIIRCSACRWTCTRAEWAERGAAWYAESA